MIITGDCCKILPILKESPELVFADPPYNIGFKYDVYSDRRSSSEYLQWSEEWIRKVYDILHPNGTFWLAISDEYCSELDIICKRIGFYRRSWVIWYYTFGVAQQKNFARSHTHLLYYVKNKDAFTFDTNQRVYSDRQLKYHDKRANPFGKLPDNVWKISRVCGTFKERVTNAPNQMPLELLDRVILTCSNEGDLVLDPFSGTGTTGVSAVKNKRRYIGIELSQSYADVSRLRIEKEIE